MTLNWEQRRCWGGSLSLASPTKLLESFSASFPRGGGPPTFRTITLKAIGCRQKFVSLDAIEQMAQYTLM